MNRVNHALVIAVAAVGFTALAPKTEASVGVEIGFEPVCPYGYYDYAPYACSPYGYYGPEWFRAGVFIGAGPWFHGPAGFRGFVDNRLDVRNGYDGPKWAHGDWHFGGNELHDGRGHILRR
jgi:hypothetical protein